MGTRFTSARASRRKARSRAREAADAGDGDRLLTLQRQAGNRATAMLVQRAPEGAFFTAAAPAASHPSLHVGSSGQGVRKLQQRLNVLGADPPMKVDGGFGRLTKDAVVAFQRAHFPDDEKQWDGKVGPKTWAAIDEAYEPPEIDAEEDALGEHVKEKMDQMNTQPATADSGVHYHYNYRSDHPDRYKPEYESGYADPTLFDQEGFMTWRVKPKVSAAAAIQSWLRGLTIAECYTSMIAAEFDSVRAAIGDEKFDENYGSTDTLLPKSKRMLITPSKDEPSQVMGLIRPTDAALEGASGAENTRPAKIGEWYYFMNHPKYLLKHPGGAWQGENAIYVGREGTANEQMWAGLGTSRGTGPGGPSHVTERQMLEEMVEAYNGARDQDDLAALAKIKVANGGVLPPELEEGRFPDQLSGPDVILKAPAQTLDIPGFVKDDRPRVGGFDAEAGKKLDAAAVQALRGS